MFTITKLLSFLLVAIISVNSNVLGIDFGSNFISVGLLSTGKPITIIRNENEKRITPSLVAIEGRERFVGTRAVPKSSRKAHITANNIIQLLGRTELPPNLASPYPIPEYDYDEKRGTLYFNPGMNFTKLPVEDLAALILQQMQRLALKTQNIQIKDVVITVPSYFAQSQRQAILDAAKIANLTVLALIESNIAAAYQFGMERSRTMAQAFEDIKNKSSNVNSSSSSDNSDNNSSSSSSPLSTIGEDSAIRNVLFVDMGGSQTALSLVHYEFPKPNNTETNKHKTRKEKHMEALKKKKEEEERKKKAEEMKAEEEEDEDEDEEDEDEDDEVSNNGTILVEDEETDVMNETPEEKERRMKEEAGLNGEEEDDEDEDDPTRGSITIRNQADLDAYMKKQNEWQAKKKAKEEKKKQRYAIKTLKRSKRQRRARMEGRGGNSFDPNRYIGKMEVLLTTTDESLGGRQIDSLLVNYLLSEYHKKAAPDEYEKYGECRTFVYKDEKDREEIMKEEERVAPEFKRYIRTPLNPRLSSLSKNISNNDLISSHRYPGLTCQKLINSTSTLTQFFRTASTAKEMLSVAPEWHGSLDDILPELSEFKVVLDRKKFEEICQPVFEHFRGVVKRFLNEYEIMSRRMKEEIEKDEEGRQSHLFDLYSIAPLSSVVVQIMGGSMRVPALQNILLEEFQKEIDKLDNNGEEKKKEGEKGKVTLGRLLNVDEAAAFGSTMYAATLIPRYSVKGVMLVEHSPRRITMKINNINSESSDALSNSSSLTRLPSHKSPLYVKGMFNDPSIIFVDDSAKEVDVIPVGTPLPCQKTLYFTRSSPFSLSFNYPSNTEADVSWQNEKEAISSTPANGYVRLPSLPLPEGVSSHILSVNVSGSASFLPQFSSPVDYVTKVMIEIEKDGILRVRKAILEVATEVDRKRVEEVKKKEEEEEEEAKKEEETEGKEEIKEEEKKEEKKESENSSSSESKKKNKYIRRMMALEIHPERKGTEEGVGGFHRYFPLTKKEIKNEQKELERFDEFEREKNHLSELFNKLETYVFEMKDKIENERKELLTVAEEEQIDNAQSILEETGIWLDEEGAGLSLPNTPQSEEEEEGKEGDKEKKGPLQIIQEKLDLVEGACGPMVLRLSEKEAFPVASSELKKLIDQLREKQDDAVANEQMTEEEADEMERGLEEALDWLKEKEAENKASAKGTAPPTTSKDVKEKMKEVEKAANDAIINAERRMRQEKYEKEKKRREEKRRKEKEKLLKEKKQREEAKLKKLSKANPGYEEILENQGEDADEDDDYTSNDGDEL